MKKESFNRDWFFYNDLKHTKPAAVTLPHDAMLTETRLPEMKNGAAAGFCPGGRYVYTKKFIGDKEFSDKAVILEFEGVYQKSSVYLNGEKIGGWVYGYTGFYVDLTDKIREGEENEVKVIADNSQTPNSRWYTGSGIYRNVNLYIGEKRHIPLDGVCITTENISPATIHVVTDMALDDGEELVIEVWEYEKGKRTQKVASGKGTDCMITVPYARLWDEDTPNLYEVQIQLMVNDNCIDEQKIVTGIRTLEWSAENGILINGRMRKLRGGCIHHDNGILGACAYEKVEYRKAKIMKESGFNAIRSAHNPISKEMLAACDELGIYIMDEAFDQWKMHKSDYDYALYFEEEWRKDSEAMVYKDRNHPSVIMYSIGNEIADTGSESGAQISREMTALFHKMDPTRPTTNGINPVVSNMGGVLNNAKVSKDDVVDPYEETANAAATASLLANMIVTATPFIQKWMCKPKKVEKLLKPCFDEVDIAGYNYAENCYGPHHKWNPDRIMVGTETYPQSVAVRWPLIKDMNGVVGDFMWTAVDYLGEAGVGVPIYGSSRGGFNRPYPCIAGGCGAINLLGEPETEAYHAAIAWGKYDKPYIAVRPVNHSGEKYFLGMWRGTDARSSWSWAGCEGKTAEIEVYSKGDSVQLNLNGKSLGRKKLQHCKAEFKTVYAPGQLVAVSYDQNGKKLGVSKLVSAKEETILTARAEKEVLNADGEDLTFIDISITDKNGVRKMLQDQTITVKVSGAGELLALGSANPVTEQSYLENKCSTWYGNAGCYIRNNGEKGSITVEITTSGIEKKIVNLTAR